MNPAPNTDVDQFIRRFLTAPLGSSPENIQARMLHWVEVANNPEKFNPGSGPYELAAKRKTARQNLRRLVARHPEVAARMTVGVSN